MKIRKFCPNFPLSRKFIPTKFLKGPIRESLYSWKFILAHGDHESLYSRKLILAHGDRQSLSPRKFIIAKVYTLES